MVAGGASPLQGRAFAPGSSRDIAAEIHLREDTVFLTDPESQTVLTRCPRAQLVLGDLVGSAPRNIHFPDHWLFQTTAPGISLMLNEPLHSRLLRHFETFHPRLIAVTGAAILAVIALWIWFVPALVAVAVWLTPAQVAQQIDRGTLASMDYLMANPSTLTSDQQQAQRIIFETLQKQAALPHRELTLQFRNMPGFGPNAFALPGGSVVLTDELVQRYGEDSDLIAGVLAHEIGHVAENHGLKQLYRSLSAYILIALIAGDVGPILEDIAFEGQTFANLAFSRRHERAADAYALQLLDQTRYDVAGLQRFFQAIAAHDSASDWVSTHPLSKERVETIEAWRNRP